LEYSPQQEVEKTYLCTSLQPLVHLIYSKLWLHHVRSVSPIKRTKRRGIEGVMWSAGHLVASRGSSCTG
ncbi:hypothetical protein XELAEV_18008951mg, partial [Xenopus laevis]